MSDQLSMDGGLIISANYESRLHDGAVSTDFAYDQDSLDCMITFAKRTPIGALSAVSSSKR